MAWKVIKESELPMAVNLPFTVSLLPVPENTDTPGLTSTDTPWVIRTSLVIRYGLPPAVHTWLLLITAGTLVDALVRRQSKMERMKRGNFNFMGVKGYRSKKTYPAASCGKTD